MGYIGMCGPKGYGFSAVLVIHRVLNLAILVISRVWFLYSGLDMGIFLRRSHFFIIIEKKVNKSPSQIRFTVIYIGLSYRTTYKAILKQGFDLSLMS